MSTPLVVSSSIYINAAPEKVWEALVNPEQTKKYMFGCETVSDWKTGSSLLWRGEYEGKQMVFVKGFILDIQPAKMLRYSVTDPNADWEDVPENYLNVTYRLSPENNGTLLSVQQDGFENAAEGEKRYKDVYNNGEGWNPILLQIKSLLESA
jgi:uncharacterized protein YndB with AHSA1/START domain